MTRRRWPALVAAGILAAGCSSGTTGATPGTTGTASGSSPVASTPAAGAQATTPPTPGPGASVVAITVSVAGGKVTPPVHRVEVPRGSRVALTVTSDVADAVHVHGYDLQAALPAGKPAHLEFTADQVGLFEVETHETGLQLVQLVVR